jgi:hypothetical protein
MQKHKDILVAVPKRIYNNLLYRIAMTDSAVELKSPLHMNPLESVRGNKYLCVSSMASHKSNLVQ